MAERSLRSRSRRSQCYPAAMAAGYDLRIPSHDIHRARPAPGDRPRAVRELGVEAASADGGRIAASAAVDDVDGDIGIIRNALGLDDDRYRPVGAGLLLPATRDTCREAVVEPVVQRIDVLGSGCSEIARRAAGSREWRWAATGKSRTCRLPGPAGTEFRSGTTTLQSGVRRM